MLAFGRERRATRVRGRGRTGTGRDAIPLTAGRRREEPQRRRRVYTILIDGHAPSPRANDLLVSALGRYVHPDRQPVYSGSFLRLLEAAGVKEHSARSVLARAAGRGHLVKHRVGRRSYYGLSEGMHEQLTAGEQRIYREPPVLHDWDGVWTLVSFSLPESRRDQRYRLRVRLAWIGFGPLRDGLWIAPGRVDPGPIVADLGLSHELVAFDATSHPLTDEAELLPQVWDLEPMQASFHRFLDRWSAAANMTDVDPLVTELMLVTDWRLLLRGAPRLPASLLPDDWPAEAAAERFLELHEALARPAEGRYLELVEHPPEPPVDARNRNRAARLTSPQDP